MYIKNVYKNLIKISGIINILFLLNGCSISNDSNTQMAIIETYQKQDIQYLNHKNIVLIGGCFDILHYGHIEFLKNAKAAGDYLVVALEPDESISNYKHRTPTHNQEERAEILASIRFVDHIILLPVLKGFIDYNQLVTNIKPQVIAITANDPQITNKQKQASTVGAIVKVVTPRLKDFSSTNIRKCYTNTTKIS